MKLGKILAGLLLGVGLCVGLAGSSQAQEDRIIRKNCLADLENCRLVAIQSSHSNRYVRGGIPNSYLKATATRPDVWERFWLVQYKDSSMYSIVQDYSDKVVRVGTTYPPPEEGGYLYASCDSSSEFCSSLFRVIPLSSGKHAIQHVESGKFVTPIGQNGLIASQDHILVWEEYNIIDLDENVLR